MEIDCIQVDDIYEMVKDKPEYKNLGMDQQGEFCMKLAKLADELLIIVLEDKNC